MESTSRYHLEPQTGIAFELQKGQTLRVIDPTGEQVSDVVAFASAGPSRANASEWLSSGRTIDYNNTIYQTTGHVLYTNRSNPMFTILEDRVGRHDFLLTPCSPETFEMLYEEHHGYHPSCFENLTQNFERFGVVGDDLPTTFNVFMNVEIQPSGEIAIGPPLSKPGDFIDLRAEMDLVVGITACSAEKSNNHRLKPIDLKVFA
ncbi:MAG: urea carboxylase-associated family protein [Actinomycetota bacterium]|nr:urea carboxylase-associated family protein [Actinomycetota bacterium]